MAVTVLAKPSSPNLTGTKLVYSLSSSLAINPQYQYVVDIHESGSSTRLTRLYAYPNEYGSGIAEVSRVLNDNLDFDKDWKVTAQTAPVLSAKDFTLHYSESYGTSISSSVTIYAGGATSEIEAFPGTLDPNGGTFNFDTGSYPATNVLSNFPFVTTDAIDLSKKRDFKNIKSTDYETLTVSYGDSLLSSVTYKTYNSAGSVLATNSLSTFTDSFYNIPAGVQNLIDAGGALETQFDTTAWTYYSIEFTLADASDKTYWYKRNDTCVRTGESIRFAFINNYGFYDYYNIYNPIKESTNLMRNSFDKPNVDYSSPTSYYDITRRGTDQYNISYMDKYVVSTEYVGKETSDWLTEMLDSTEVYIQSGTDFIPIVITNGNYSWNLSNNREKTFKYDIEFSYANKRYDR
tara:strand:+ start:1243 stop:2457 length:1215 start_codon:yes stop_codon:yes gene_type:complete